MKQIRQFRYYGDNNNKTYPSFLSKKDLTTKNIFEQCGRVVQLGVQGVPNTIFYLNDSEYPIMIGSLGVFELDLDGLTTLGSIKFDSDSLDLYADGAHGLIIDIVFNGGGE